MPGLHVGLAGAVEAAEGDPAELWGGEEAAGSEDITQTISPSSDDVVEVIEANGAPAEPDVAPEATDAEEGAAPTRIQASGYARQSFELFYGDLSRKGADETSRALWRDTFISRTQLVLRASYQRPRHFEATVSGVLGYTLHIAKDPPDYSVGVVRLTRGELEPELREAYVGFFWPSFDLWIGQQRVAWGRADFQSPNDVINARDLRDPFLTQTELRHVPTPVIRGRLASGPWTLEAVVSPIFIPDRFDVYGTNWSAIQSRARPSYQGFLGNASTLADATIERTLAALWRQTELPESNGKGASAGARLAASLPGVDLSAYYHYGFDSLPFVSLDPLFTSYLDATDFTTLAASNLAPLLELVDSGVQPLLANYIRRHHLGFDLGTAIGPVVLRLDTAYQSQRVFYAYDLTSFASPTLLGVASLEYQTGSLDDTFIVELLGARLLKAPASPLLGYERDSAAVAGTVRVSLSDSWGIDFRALVGIKPDTYTLLPALRYKPNDAFSLRLGALVMGGAPGSFGWYYGDNDSAFVQLRYAF